MSLSRGRYTRRLRHEAIGAAALRLDGGPPRVRLSKGEAKAATGARAAGQGPSRALTRWRSLRGSSAPTCYGSGAVPRCPRAAERGRRQRRAAPGPAGLSPTRPNSSGVGAPDPRPHNSSTVGAPSRSPAVICSLGGPSSAPRPRTLMVTFPLVILRMLKPTVGIMSSLNCPDWKGESESGRGQKRQEPTPGPMWPRTRSSGASPASTPTPPPPPGHQGVPGGSHVPPTFRQDTALAKPGVHLAVGLSCDKEGSGVAPPAQRVPPEGQPPRPHLSSGGTGGVNGPGSHLHKAVNIHVKSGWVSQPHPTCNAQQVFSGLLCTVPICRMGGPPRDLTRPRAPWGLTPFPITQFHILTILISPL